MNLTEEMNLMEEAYLMLLAPEFLPRRGIIRTIMVWLTLSTFYYDLRSLLPDPPSGGPRPVKASPSSMSGLVPAGVNRTIPA